MTTPARDRWTDPASYLKPRRSARLLAAPRAPAQRFTLYALRRMGAHGLHDAQAASLMLDRFGLPFRRPLVLLRTVMLELSRAASRPIMLAPCCCQRMTPDEARLLAVLRHAAGDEPRARRHLGRLTGGDGTIVQGAAAAYGAALTDLGQPLG